MKKMILLAAIALLGAPAFSLVANATPQDTPPAKTPPAKAVTVDRLVHDFGTVQESAGTVKTTFYVINNTDEPVMILNVRTTCGCTVPTWTKTPIEPGKKGAIDVVFTTADRAGQQFSKDITIITSNNQTLKVSISGTVE
ncbi:hypothetical protein AGMMS4957_04910 [Bacteroidia bacterium]|nr:hypothetical protein AGMMS4957_04910 [Bacteroidia bacterium]